MNVKKCHIVAETRPSETFPADYRSAPPELTQNEVLDNVLKFSQIFVFSFLDFLHFVSLSYDFSLLLKRFPIVPTYKKMYINENTYKLITQPTSCYE